MQFFKKNMQIHGIFSLEHQVNTSLEMKKTQDCFPSFFSFKDSVRSRTEFSVIAMTTTQPHGSKRFNPKIQTTILRLLYISVCISQFNLAIPWSFATTYDVTGIVWWISKQSESNRRVRNINTTSINYHDVAPDERPFRDIQNVKRHSLFDGW